MKIKKNYIFNYNASKKVLRELIKAKKVIRRMV